MLDFCQLHVVWLLAIRERWKLRFDAENKLTPALTNFYLLNSKTKNEHHNSKYRTPPKSPPSCLCPNPPPPHISSRGNFMRCAWSLGLSPGNLGHRCLHSSRPMDLNKRREQAAFDRLLANKPELDCPYSLFFFWIIEPAQRNPYERPRLTI
jgi:hypothetical protein